MLQSNLNNTEMTQLILLVLIIHTFLPLYNGFNTHVIQCIHDIVVTHFSTDAILAISFNNWSHNVASPRLQENIQGSDDLLFLLLRDINNIGETVLVHNLDNNNTNHSELPRALHGYIILHQKEYDIEEHILKLKNNIDWNPRARFIILIVEYTHVLSRNYKNMKYIENVFLKFWLYNVVNVILITEASESISKSKDAKKSIFEIFTWFPYAQGGLCGESFNLVLLDRWIFSQNFQNNSRLFPKKIPHNFAGCPLRISTFELEPVVMDRGGSPADNTLRPEPHDGKWGIRLPNGTWTGVIRELIEQVSDIAFGEEYYRCHLETLIECTTPYLYDETIWYIPCAQPNPRWTSLFRVFKFSLWLAFVLGFILVSILIWIIVKVSNKIIILTQKYTTYTNLTKCFLNLWAVILGISATESIPNKAVIRMVFLLWVIYSLAFNTVYQTFLTSFMVNPGLQNQISSVDELLQSKMGYGMVRTLEALIPDLKDKRYTRRQICPEIEPCIARMAHTRDFAVLHSKYTTDYSAYVRYVDSNGDPLFCHLEETFSRQYVTMSVQKGNLLLDKYNKLIQYIIESGLLEQWWKEMKYLATLKAAGNFSMPQGDYVPLSTDHMQSAFYLLVLGFVLSCIIFIYESCQQMQKKMLLQRK